MPLIKHTTNLSTTIYLHSLNLRKKVFVEEQNVPIGLEIEGESSCIHFVLYDDEQQPQATARLLPIDKETYKVQRMAVAKEARKKGYGRMLMEYVEGYAFTEHAKKLILGAQTQAIPFYESLGFKVVGEEYLDAGIKHFDMIKELTS